LLPVLFAAGGNPNVKLIHRVPSKPDTMLAKCIWEEDIPTLRMLLKHGTDPNLPCGWSPPIVLAAEVGNLEIFRLLIGSGAALFGDPNIAAKALFAAVERGHIAIAQFLVEQGISFRSRKYSGKSALEFAREKGMVEVLDLFRGHKRAKKSPSGPANRSQPVGPETNRTSSAAGSGG